MMKLVALGFFLILWMFLDSVLVDLVGKDECVFAIPPCLKWMRAELRCALFLHGESPCVQGL